MAVDKTHEIVADSIKSAIDSLGPAYVFLTPEQMADLYGTREAR